MQKFYSYRCVGQKTWPSFYSEWFNEWKDSRKVSFSKQQRSFHLTLNQWKMIPYSRRSKVMNSIQPDDGPKVVSGILGDFNLRLSNWMNFLYFVFFSFCIRIETNRNLSPLELCIRCFSFTGPGWKNSEKNLSDELLKMSKRIRSALFIVEYKSSFRSTRISTEVERRWFCLIEARCHRRCDVLQLNNYSLTCVMTRVSSEYQWSESESTWLRNSKA
jgi:hypothetical protein